MTTRRGRGEGSIYYDDGRDRWVGVLDVTEPGTAQADPPQGVRADQDRGQGQKLDALRRELADAGAPGRPRAPSGPS